MPSSSKSINDSAPCSSSVPKYHPNFDPIPLHWYPSKAYSRRESRNLSDSWIRQKLDNIKMRNIRKLYHTGPMNPSDFAESLKGNKGTKFHCYRCKREGHYAWECPQNTRNKGKQAEYDSEVKSTKAQQSKAEKKPYVQKYHEMVCFSGDYLVQGTETGHWDRFWYVNTKIGKHMSPNRSLFHKLRNTFNIDENEHPHSFVFTHGIGGVNIKTNETKYTIPYVSYTPEVNINLLSMKQLILQGFEIEIEGETCKITHMFDPMSYKLKKMKEEFEEEEVLRQQDSFLDEYFNNLDESGKFDVEIDNEDLEDAAKFNTQFGKGVKEENVWEVVSIEVNCINDFIKFLDLVNDENVIMQNKLTFKRAFEEMVQWYHSNYTETKVEGVLPPKVAGVNVCLFDLYNIVIHTGGYEDISKKDGWKGVAMGMGFSETYDAEVKKIYETFLLHPHSYYEFTQKARKGQEKYPERQRTLLATDGHVASSEEKKAKDQDDFLDHIQTSIEHEAKLLGEDNNFVFIN